MISVSVHKQYFDINPIDISKFNFSTFCALPSSITIFNVENHLAWT